MRHRYAVAKARASPTSIAISPDGEHFALTATDFKVRLYKWASGTCRRSFDESYDAMHALQKEGDDAYRLEAFDFGRRMAVEREYRAALPAAPPSNVLFDDSGRFLIYPSVVGIKVISVETSRLARTWRSSLDGAAEARAVCAAAPSLSRERRQLRATGGAATAQCRTTGGPP